MNCTWYNNTDRTDTIIDGLSLLADSRLAFLPYQCDISGKRRGKFWWQKYLVAPGLFFCGLGTDSLRGLEAYSFCPSKYYNSAILTPPLSTTHLSIMYDYSIFPSIFLGVRLILILLFTVFQQLGAHTLTYNSKFHPLHFNSSPLSPFVVLLYSLHPSNYAPFS